MYKSPIPCTKPASADLLYCGVEKGFSEIPLIDELPNLIFYIRGRHLDRTLAALFSVERGGERSRYDVRFPIDLIPPHAQSPLGRVPLPPPFFFLSRAGRKPSL